MKYVLAVWLFLLSNQMAFALNPVQAWYAGLIVGGSKANSIDFTVLMPIRDMVGPGSISYTVLGNLGGQLGYRMKQFRVEGEVLYNNNPYKHLTINGVDIPNNGSPATTVQQLSIQSKTVTNPFTFTGYTNTYALMFNGIYDIYIPEYTEHVVPYVGLGIGYQHVENNLKFFNNGIVTPLSVFGEIANNVAGQAIVGLSYYVNDYMSFSFDGRYLSSLQTNEADSLLITFKHRPQLYSINFVFNSAFNLG